MTCTTRRRHGGRRNISTRKSRGIFGTVYSPVHGALNVGRKVLRTGLKKGVNIPMGAVRGARDVVSNSVNNLIAGVDTIGHNVFHGADNIVSGVFKRKNSRRSSRKHGGSRKNRKASRKNRKASRKNRKASRKNRKASRKNRRNSRENVTGGRRRKGSRTNSRKNRTNSRK